MTSKTKNKTTLQPGNEARGNQNFSVIIATRDWEELSMPKQEPRHPELKHNEVFLMNVTATEFAWFASGNIHMQDFKSVRLGKVAYKTCSSVKVDESLGYRPMFGALRRSARLRRKYKKETKKQEKKEKKEKERKERKERKEEK